MVQPYVVGEIREPPNSENCDLAGELGNNWRLS